MQYKQEENRGQPEARLPRCHGTAIIYSIQNAQSFSKRRASVLFYIPEKSFLIGIRKNNRRNFNMHERM